MGREKIYLCGQEAKIKVRLHEPSWEQDRIIYGPRAAHALKLDNSGNDLQRMYDQLVRLLNAQSDKPQNRTSTQRFALLRQAHLALYGRTCPGWEKRKPHKLQDSDELTIDHIKPRSEGGTNKRDNLTVMCARCNHARGRHTWKGYRRTKKN